MTKPDTNRADQETGMSVSVKRALLGSIGGIVLIFLIGVLAGFTSAVFDDRAPTSTDFAVIGTLIVTIAGLAFAMWKFWPDASSEPISESTRKSNNLLYIAMAVGVALGLFGSLLGPEDSMAIFSNSPMDGLVAGISLAVWVIIVPIITWMWWKVVDEHEASAYTDGALISAHVYLIGAPAWWIAWRAGWMPPQDPMIMFLIIASLWSAIWLYKRYF